MVMYNDPVMESIMGAQDREFSHASSMQSRDLSARQSMHKSSLANALKIANLQYGTQRYGIDVGAETDRRGQDFQKEIAFRGQDFDQEARRWSNALGYLSMAAQLRGPENYFQAANFYRGASQTDFPAFLQSLLGNGGIGNLGARELPSFTGTNGAGPAPATMQTLAAGMTAGQPTGTPTGAATTGQSGQMGILNAINQIASNMGQLPGGAMENLTDTEQQLFASGAEYLGHDLPSLLNQYANSRVGQGSSRAA